MTEKVFVALSGGVDSAVSAFLLKEQGYQIIGLHALFWEGDNNQAENNEKRAKKVAEKLDIPFKSCDLRTEFNDIVIKYYLGEYQKGRTPNPCVVCNQEIKFGLLYDKAIKLGADKFSTGHYVVIKDKQIVRGNDKGKDQSYFLWKIDGKILPNLIFPIGDKQKKEVKKIAETNKLVDKETPESRGACFIDRENHQDFIKQYGGKLTEPGEVVNQAGEAIGKHKGIAFYTIGQRFGFEIDHRKLDLKRQDPPAMYVIGNKPKANQLIVGKNKDLYKDMFEAEEINWISSKPAIKGEKTFEGEVQVRYQQAPVKAKIDLNQEKMNITTEEEIRAVVPGQSVVVYQSDRLLGGGVISQVS